MKTLKITSIAAAVLAASSFSQVANAEVSVNVSATSNYLWRGLEQTGGAAAVSGGIDYASDSGFYAGTWASNASWGDMKTELDFYFGFGGDISDSVSYDVGYVYFAYPDSVADENDFSEVYANISTGGFTFGVAVLADSEAGGDGGEFGDSVYATIDYGIALDSGAEIGLHLGDYSGDFSTESTDFGISVSKDSITVGVSKTDFDDGADSDDLKFYVSYSVDFAL
ncbi:TorF family putative porin [Paraglaciecola aquimarina]|uniref:TorF family putative porin n=1 Tax=Paraglaciecola algarum TaxID=3050085 RepID=A0ABS9D5C4_9ALTE|nr:TorF family putative porin [Paraglaciecola sp. G1-23]MCF2947625.1 TorF family putative porin [Paraglaciecola sp. G1-23]